MVVKCFDEAGDLCGGEELGEEDNSKSFIYRLVPNKVIIAVNVYQIHRHIVTELFRWS